MSYFVTSTFVEWNVLPLFIYYELLSTRIFFFVLFLELELTWVMFPLLTHLYISNSYHVLILYLRKLLSLELHLYLLTYLFIFLFPNEYKWILVSLELHLYLLTYLFTFLFPNEYRWMLVSLELCLYFTNLFF